MSDDFLSTASLATNHDGGTGFAQIGDLLPDLTGSSTLSDKIGDAVFNLGVLFTGVVHGVEGVFEV